MVKAPCQTYSAVEQGCILLASEVLVLLAYNFTPIKTIVPSQYHWILLSQDGSNGHKFRRYKYQKSTR
jgi:hypothetical protein